MRQGVIGCALSHVKIYEKLLYKEKDTVDGYVIFEDDVTVDQDFMNRMKRVFTVAEGNENVDIIFFTTTPKKYNQPFKKSGLVRKYSFDEIKEYSCGGTGCYYISKRGAREVLNYIDTHSLTVGIDVLLYKLAHQIAIYFTHPSIITQCADNTSDIQSDFHTRSPLYENDNIIDTNVDTNVIYNQNGEMDLFENLTWM